MELNQYHGLRPPPMDFISGNIAENWRKWSQHMRLLLDGPFAEKEEKQKCSFILLYIGEQGREIYSTFTFTNLEKDQTEPIFTKFETYCKPKKNTIMARFRFNSRIQKQSENIDSFVTDLRILAADCEYGDLKESLIRDRIIVGTNDARCQEKLLQETDITLEKALEIARSFEASKQHMSDLGARPVQVSAINHKKKGATTNKFDKKQKQQSSAQASTSAPKCQNCGNNHPDTTDSCPARGKICSYCKKRNHFVRMCRKLKSKNRRVHEVQDNNDSDDFSEFDDFEALTFETIDVGKTKFHTIENNEIFTVININVGWKQATALKVKVDSGAQGDALPLRIYKRIFPSNIGSDGKPKPGALVKSHSTLVSYGGHKIEQYGICKIPCWKGKKKVDAKFFVTADSSNAIIGLPTALALGLITVNCAISNDQYTPIQTKEDVKRTYPQLFDGIGKFPGKYHINIDSSAKPVIHPPRRVALSLKSPLKSELDRMSNSTIITKLKEGEPTEWVNSMVYREKKDGSLRICLDPKDLNKYIKREHYTTPTIEEIRAKSSGAKVFSVVDVKCGYWHVELDEQSSYLTTFNTPFGRYRYLRMPFGCKMSQDVFQQKMDQIFEGCPGVAAIHDDIVVAGIDDADHDRNFHMMCERAIENGTKFNYDKCQIKLPQISFYGSIFNDKGTKPDPKKVSAIKQMAPPTSKQELESFLGLITYMSPFIPNASDLTSPLRQLLKKDSQFEWSASHNIAFNKLKSVISDEVTLAHFNTEDDNITLQVDSSGKGLGAALFQSGKPVAYASKSLTDTESRYANIERELLAVVYGCEKFKTYLYGRSFVVESDHKPLESIHLKHLTSAPPRLQRMLLRLQGYDMSIKYVPQKYVGVADALSRLSPEEKYPIKDMDITVHEVCPQFTPSIIQRIRTATQEDPELNALKETTFTGWPDDIKNVPMLCKPYWTYREEITIDDGILMKGSRIIIPKSMQPEILTKLHTSHLGTEKTKLRAKTSVFWRNINRDIEDMTKSCMSCQLYKPKQVKEPLKQPEVPPRPWHTVGTDIFYLDGDEYLLIADYYSKFPFVQKIPQDRVLVKLWLTSEKKYSTSMEYLST